MCTDTKGCSGPSVIPLHYTTFSKGKWNFLQGSWLGVDGDVYCDIVFAQGSARHCQHTTKVCICKVFIPKFGQDCYGCEHLVWTTSLNTAHFELGEIFVPLLFICSYEAPS